MYQDDRKNRGKYAPLGNFCKNSFEGENGVVVVLLCLKTFTILGLVSSERTFFLVLSGFLFFKIGSETAEICLFKDD